MIPRQMPSKRIVAKLLLANPAGEMLIVNFTYREGWGLVGGMVEDGEPILAAALRELQEETGLRLKPERLKLALTHYTSPGDLPDHVHFLFSATLTTKEISAIKLAPQEASDLKFVPVKELNGFVSSPVVVAVVQMHSQGLPAAYAEDGKLAVPV